VSLSSSFTHKIWLATKIIKFLNDVNRILFNRSEIALAKHSNNSYFLHLYVKLIYTVCSKKFRWCELIFADKLILTTKVHTHKIWQASSKKVLFIIYNKEFVPSVPTGCSYRSHWGGTHGTKLINFQTKKKNNIKHSLIFIKLGMNSFGP